MKLICCYLLLLSFIVAQGLKNEAYFWHVADFHLDLNYSAKVGRDYFLGDYDYKTCWGSDNPGKFGNYQCDSPLALLNEVTRLINETSADLTVDGKLPFILWTGDDTAHIANELSSSELTYEAIRLSFEALKATSLDLFPVLGNHDAFPHNQFKDDPADDLYAATADIFKSASGFEAVVEQYKANGAFYKATYGPYLLVGLNTNIYYRSNNQLMGSNDPLGQFVWLEQVLSDARNQSRKVLLFAHIPPGKFERFYQYFKEEEQHGFPWFKPNYNQKLLSILVAYSDVLHPQLYGHHHTDTFKLIKNGTGHTVGVGLLAPAVTPWRSTLAPETGANNPSLRLYKYNAVSGEILQYTQYYANLSRANAEGQLTWEIEYIFPDAYNVSGLSINDFDTVFEDMASNEDVFSLYYELNSVQKVDYECDKLCQTYHLCTISEQDYTKFEECILRNAPNHGYSMYFGNQFLITSASILAHIWHQFKYTEM